MRLRLQTDPHAQHGGQSSCNLSSYTFIAFFKSSPDFTRLLECNLAPAQAHRAAQTRKCGAEALPSPARAGPLQHSTTFTGSLEPMWPWLGANSIPSNTRELQGAAATAQGGDTGHTHPGLTQLHKGFSTFFSFSIPSLF